MNKNNETYGMVKKYFVIILGSVLMALSVNLIYEPLGLVTGGVSGVAIIVKYLTVGIIPGGLPVWLFTVICNVPLFLIAGKVNGIRSLITNVFGTIAFILTLMVIPIIDLKLDDMLLSSIMGGVLGGIGIGLVFSSQASTGGTDLLASVIHTTKKHMSIPMILGVVDGVVILAGAVVFGLGNALYAIIAVVITSKISDGILEGLKFAKMAYIISDHYEEIADAVMNQIGRGVTGVSATGMYSNQEKKMLFCVVSRKEIVRITEISQKIDPKSFVIVSDVREVMGEGFIEYRQ